VQGQKRNICNFYNLESDSRNITNSMTFFTKSSNQNFVIFLNKVQAAIIGNKGSDFFAIINQLDSHTLPDGRIGLLGFHTNFFQDNPFCVRCSSKWAGLQGSAQMSFLILFVMPLLVSPVASELSSSMKTMALTHAAAVWAPLISS
uniref:Uncharacterized protein n=1 Tax=Vombatus ursinus TaxID=29139 RepID=A0A4X2MF02_VOMUR